MTAASTPAAAQQQQKPNILFIMGDDIGWMQPSIYHRGLMVGETPNIDRIGNEGAIFMDYVAMQSCTSGRNAFFTGMYPVRTGMIPPQLPGSPSYLRPGTPAVAKFLLDLGYNTGEFGKNHLGDHTEALPTAHGFQEYWGYLYHLDAMQQVSFPDINKSPTEQTIAPPCRNTPIPGIPEVPGAVDPKTTICLTPPRNVLWCKSSDGTAANQTMQRRGSADLGALEDRGRGNLRQGHRLPRPQRPAANQQAVLRLVQSRAHARDDRAVAEILRDGGRARRQGLGRQRSRHEADGRQHRPRPPEDRGHGPDQTTPSWSSPPTTAPRRSPSRTAASRHSKARRARPGKAATAPRWSCAGRDIIRPGTVKNQLFAALDWLPTFVNIAGGPKGDGLKQQIEAGQYPGIVKTTLDGVDQRDYLEGTSEKSARDFFFYYSGATPSAVRYKNWKMYYTMSQPGPAGWILPLIPFHFTLVDNIKRDPFEQAVGIDQKTAMSIGGALGGPLTAFQYDWNMLPIGQQLWMKHLLTFEQFPPLQPPETYNLSGIMEQVKKANARAASD